MKPWAPDRTKSFKDDPERMFGIESRSLKGCYEFIEVVTPVAWNVTLYILPSFLLFGVPFHTTHCLHYLLDLIVSGPGVYGID